MGMLEKFSLAGKVALVTGASYGIGYAIAKGMHEAGAKIVFCDIKQEFVDRGLASYKEDGIDAAGYVCDVTNEPMVQEMVKKIEAEIGVIDILVNNAGIIKRIPMCDMTAEEFRQVIDVDLNAPFIVSKDYQHLLHDERAGPRDRFRIRGGEGRFEDAHQKHLL